MAKYRKKPVIIEAEQWSSGKRIDGVEPPGNCGHTYKGFYHVHTLEGDMRVSEDDWIITGIAGEKYPCKPDIFEQTYEAVDA